MNRVAFQFRVKPERLAEYQAHHRQVWPEMLDALRHAGWHNYTLFLRPDGLVFGYFETEQTLAAAQKKMAAQEVNARWQAFMAPFTEAGARPDDTFVQLEEYFHLD